MYMDVLKMQLDPAKLAYFSKRQTSTVHLDTVCKLNMHILEKTITTGQEGRKEMFYLTTHSTHFIYGYMASDIW